MMALRTRTQRIKVMVATYGALLQSMTQRAQDVLAPYMEKLQLALIGAFLLTFASMPAFAQTATPIPTVIPSPGAPTIDFDLSPFFTALNTYLPIFMALFAVIGGIAGAMALSRYIIGAIVKAFSGGSVD